jgi:hypothetical protein
MNAQEPVTNLEVLVPTMAWEQMVASALQQPAYQVLVSGGALFTLYLVTRFVYAFYQLQEGQRPQWLRPLVVLAIYMLVLTHYEFIVINTIRTVTGLGTTGDGMVEVDTMFAQRSQALASAFLADHPPTGWTYLTSDGLSVVLLRLAAGMMQMLAHAVCIALRCLQIILLAVLVQTGPILIGCSLLGGPLSTLGQGWWLALVEVSAWSWVQDIALRVFAQLASATPDHPNFVHEMTLSLVFITALVAIPVISSMLLRGQSASGVGQALGASAATWAMARSQWVAQQAPRNVVRQAQNVASVVRAHRASKE